MEPNQEKKSYGALIGSVIIVVILVLGGVYFWATKQAELQNTTQKEGAQQTYEESDLLMQLDNLEAEIGLESDLEAEFDLSTIE